VLNLGVGSLGIAFPLVRVAVALILITRIGQACLTFNAIARLPLVAGWDRLLPAWFTRLHPKYKTPVGSIFFVGAGMLSCSLLTNLNVGNQEAFQLLQSASTSLWALTYLVMFAIPLVAPAEKTSSLLRMAAASGFLMTLLNVVLSVFPIIDVANPVMFTAKTGSVVIGLNLVGGFVFWCAEKRRKRAAAG